MIHGLSKFAPLERLGGLVLGFGSSLLAWAQSVPNACGVATGYAPLSAPVPAVVSAVPGLTFGGVGLLAAVLAFAAFKYRGQMRAGRMLCALLAAAAMTAFVTSADSLVTVVRAAAPFELSNANGGTLADAQVPFASPSPLVSISNTSGQRIRIVSNGKSSETGTCVVGTELALGESCTTQAVCPVVVPIQIAADPEVACDSNTPLDSFSWAANDGGSSGTVVDFAPTLATPPSVNPSMSGMVIDFTRAFGKPA